MVNEKKLLSKDLTNVATKTADADADLDSPDGTDALAYQGAEDAAAGRMNATELLEQVQIRQRQADE